jgi:dienelactone hydrolase
VLTLTVASLTLGGCLGSAPARPAAPVPPATPSRDVPFTFAVGVRVLHLSRGPERPLPTLVFYPAIAHPKVHTGPVRRGSAAGQRNSPRNRLAGRPRPDMLPTTAATPALTPANGRFPLVVFSHGLAGSPQRYAKALAGWAAAGFVVAAPVFPHTSEFTDDYHRSDIVHQPADVRWVLRRLSRLDGAAGDPLHGRIDTEHVAAVGHSAGGYTTTGLFTAGHDPRLRAGVVLAGWLADGAFDGPPATMLFLQGTSDPVVPAVVSRAAYDRVPWPKSYLLLPGESHASYFKPDGAGFATMESLVIDFLRWTLTGDDAARRRLPPDEGNAGDRGTVSRGHAVRW